jgi:hypothetical protein
MTRLACCVPHCRHTLKRTEKHTVFSEWICGDHWRMVPKIKRKAYGRRVRQWRRFKREGDVDACDRLWRRLKSIATERAVGL